MLGKAWFAILIAGCGIDAVPEAAVAPHDVVERSSDRLKIEWWETADGALEVRGVYDVALASECRFERAADGTFACEPVTGRDPRAVVANLVVQDADARVVPTSLSAGELVLPFGFYDRERGSECTPTYSVATGAYACTPPGAAPSAGDPELALVADRDDGHRLERRYFAREDGLRQHVPSFIDAELGIACDIQTPPDAQGAYCLAIGDPAGAPLPLDAYVEAIPAIDP